MRKFFTIFTFTILFICGAVFAGCAPTDSSLSLEFSTQKIELLTTSKGAEYFATINGKSGNLNPELDFNFSSTIASVDLESVKNDGSGRITFKVVPITTGDATLTILIRGTSVSLTVPVFVTEEITNFASKQNVFVRRGQTLTLGSNMFTFEPEDTTQKDLSFRIDEDLETKGISLSGNVISVNEECELNEFEVKVSSISNALLGEKTLTVKIVNKIDLLKLSVYEYIIADNYPSFTKSASAIATANPVDENGAEKITLEKIELVLNDTAKFLKKIGVEYDSLNYPYKIDVYASGDITGEISSTSPIKNKNGNFEFEVSANSVCEDEDFKLTFKVYQFDFPDNYGIIELPIYAKKAPTDIRINNKLGIYEQNLYNNSTEVFNFKFNVYPELNEKNLEGYKFSLGVYMADELGGDLTAYTGGTLTEYILAKYNNAEINNSSINNFNSLERIDGLLTLQSQGEVFEDKYIVIKISCFDGETEVCHNEIYIKVYKGTNNFSFKQDFESGILYVAMPNDGETGEVTFNSFDYDDGSTIGKLSIYPKYVGSTCANLEQDKTEGWEKNPKIIITPNYVGKSEFIIRTENGKELPLSVIVVRTITEGEFALKVAGNSTDVLSGYEVKSPNSTIDALTIKGKNKTVNIVSNITKYKDINSNTFEFELESTDQDKIGVTNKNTLVTKDFTDNVIGISVKYTLYTVQDFKLEPSEDLGQTTFDFTVKCIDYVTSVKLTASHSPNEIGQKIISVYDQKDLSYQNESLSKVYLLMELKFSEGEIVNLINESDRGINGISYKFSTENEELPSLSQLGSWSAVAGDNYMGLFTCNRQGLITNDSFDIAISFFDATGKSFESSITVVIEDYIDVDSVYLLNAIDSIYLDNTDLNRQITLSAFVLPTDAMLKDLKIYVDSQTDSVTVAQNDNNITLTFKSAGSGYIRIFPVSKLKTNGFKNAEGEYYYHISIPFVCADGSSEETALRLSTYDELKRINQDLHYYVDRQIDCGGRELYIPTFNKTIRGTFLPKTSTDFENSSQIGGIINFAVISGKENQSNIGLFGTLESSAKIYNLTVSGYFAGEQTTNNQNAKFDGLINLTQIDSNIGLLCGENKGVIQDVIVMLSRENIINIQKSGSASNVYIGTSVGRNNGTIEITRSAKESTLLVKMDHKLDINVANEFTTSYVGGIVGYNLGKIENNYNLDNFVSIGLFGINANVNVTTSAKHLGGVVGSNGAQGSSQDITVKDIKAVGVVNGASVGNGYAAGFIGKYFAGNVQNNVSRVFVRGFKTVCGFIGEINTNASVDNITNNKVQATDSGKQGLDVTLLVTKYWEGTHSGIYALCDGSLDDTNVAESYIDRNLVEIAGDYVLITDALDLSYYYGDMAVIKVINESGDEPKLQSTDNLNEDRTFNRGTDDQIKGENFVEKLAIAAFRQAKDADKQQFVLNEIDALNLFKTVGIIGKEMEISVDNEHLVSYRNFAGKLKFNGTGIVKITLRSALNYKNKAEFTLYITNYYENKDILCYNDKNHIEQTKDIVIVNSKTKNLYFKTVVDIYNYKNTPIYLKENKEITFDYVLGDDNLFVDVLNQNVYLTSKENQDGNEVVTLYDKLVIGGNSYFASFDDNLNLIVFKVGTKTESNKHISINPTIVTGIENIILDKSEILAEPTDSVEINVEYDSYNEEDKLVLSAVLVTNEYEYQMTVSESTWPNIKNLSNNRLGDCFEITTNELGENKVNYVVKMIISENNYFVLKDSVLRIYFTAEKTKEFTYVDIIYTPESISSVLMNNYSKEENPDMYLKSLQGYIDKNLVSETIYSSIGDMNIIKAYVYTNLSEFDYVDVEMNSGVVGGYIALAKEYTVKDEEGVDVKVQKIETNLIYSTIGNVVSLRIPKDMLIDENFISNKERTLCITLVYSLPRTLDIGTRVPIDLYFFKNGENIYSCGTSVVAKTSSKVEFTLKDVNQDTNNIDKYDAIYSVTKGTSYVVELDINGYSEDSITFTSSNQNIASIIKVENIYYLNISNVSISYGGKPYYEVEITLFGTKTENNVTTISRNFVVLLKVYEVLLSNEVFDNKTISLRLLETVNIKEMIANKIVVSSNESGSKTNFLDEFMSQSEFTFISNGISKKFDEGAYIKGADYILNGNTLKPLTVAEVAPYKIIVSLHYAYVNGYPTCGTENVSGDNYVYEKTVEFNIEVYMNSSEKIPTPINNYEELKNVKDGEYYRLVNDIEINGADFTPISAVPAMLDGNCYKIKILGSKIGTDIISVENYALFERIESGSIFKNIYIYIDNANGSTIEIDNSNASGANIALLCAVNDGIITNCEIQSKGMIRFNIKSLSTSMENTYIGSLAGVNNGFITNCRSYCNISVSGGSLAGLVAINRGKISSSFVREARLVNETSKASQNIVSGGFVCDNQGQITMSYVEGVRTSSIFSDYLSSSTTQSKIIYSAPACAGFVYSNSGSIFDCYSNIPILSSSMSAGFVGTNNGTINRVYSLSKLKSNDTLSHGFVTAVEESSVFENCFFVIQNGTINHYTSESNYTLEGNTYGSKIDGVVPLSVNDFSDEGNFKEFIISGNPNKPTEGVWFWANKTINGTHETEVNDFNTYDIDSKVSAKSSFTDGVLHLVAPNKISYSRYNLYISESGENSYSIDDENLRYGSELNPYLISSASEFESYCNQKNSKEYFRLIADIDYEAEEIYKSDLYSKTLSGYFEGNNFNVSNYSVNSMTSYMFGGLFAQFGLDNSGSISTLKNVKFSPRYINLPNCSYVGGIAGSLTQANVYNVSIEGKDVIVSGNNFVGGLFGRTAGMCDICEISANVIVRSTRYDSSMVFNRDKLVELADAKSNIRYQERTSAKQGVSYSGGLVGFLGGDSEVRRVKIGEDTKTFGVISGLLFGSVGAFSTVSDVNLELNSYNNEIHAFAFGGIFAGELLGKIKNVTLNSDILLKKLFSCDTIVPIAIGGVAGIMIGEQSEISNLKSDGFSVIGYSYSGTYVTLSDVLGANDVLDGNSDMKALAFDLIRNPYVVKYVGGLVGYMTSGTIKNIEIGQESEDKGLILGGGNYVGGVVAYANTTLNDLTISNVKIIFTSHLQYTNEIGTEIDEFVYTQYVSAIGANIDNRFTFDEKTYFGLAVGYNEFSEEQLSVDEINAEISKPLIIMMEKYGKASDSEQFNILYVGNDCKKEGGSSDLDKDIFYLIKSLSDSSIENLNKGIVKSDN